MAQLTAELIAANKSYCIEDPTSSSHCKKKH